MSVLDRAREHFESLKGETIEIPEWGENGEDGEPFVVHFDPLTMSERRRVARKHKDDDAAATVTIVIMKARDHQGKALFDEKDRVSLMGEVDPKIVARIAKAIMGDQSVEDAEKN